MLFVTNWVRNSGKMKGNPEDIWTVRISTVKFPGDIWTVCTVKTGLGLRLRLGFFLRLDVGLGLVLGFELVFSLGLGLGLVMTVQCMTVQILTVQIKTGNHGTVSSPHFLAHVYCRQTAGWIKMPFGIEVHLGPDHIVLDGNPAHP